MPRTYKILIAPLDWGLGHTTRCIPIIKQLLAAGHTVVAAAVGGPAKLLEANFPRLRILPLEGYRITYSRSPRTFSLKIMAQIPKILRAIKKERLWLDTLLKSEHFDLVISDNRYGLHTTTLPCWIMTHQLQIQTGMGRLADRVLQRLHHGLLRKFYRCLVVDDMDKNTLAGKLAHAAKLPMQACSFTGCLSQFSGMDKGSGSVRPHEILILLSGPEPMRGRLEKILLAQARALKQYHFHFVAGKAQTTREAAIAPHINYYASCNAAQLLPMLQSAAMVVCRSGYSTIMDLAMLQKKALLIPTPGQTEQEYLANYLSGKKYFFSSSQQDISLQETIPKVLASNRQPPKPVESIDFALLAAKDIAYFSSTK
ncbi:MAG: glycosyltransferase [Edaphocola sp.]